MLMQVESKFQSILKVLTLDNFLSRMLKDYRRRG